MVVLAGVLNVVGGDSQTTIINFGSLDMDANFVFLFLMFYIVPDEAEKAAECCEGC